MKSLGKTAPKSRRAGAKEWDLRLYVGARTPRTFRAFENLQKICQEHLAGNYTIEVIDLVKSPYLAAREQIVALPTLIRRVRGRSALKIIGDFSDTRKVLAALDVRDSVQR